MRSLRVLFLTTRDWYNPATTGGDNTLWESARYLASVGHNVTLLCSSFRGAEPETTIDGIHVVRRGGIFALWLTSFFYYMTHCRGKIDLVVAEGFGGSRIPRLVPLYVREPIITAWHQVHRDLFAAQYPRALAACFNQIERIAAWVHRDTYVQAYTEEWRREFPELGFRPDRIFIVPVSIRDDWAALPARRPLSDPRIVWIGKFRRYKRPDHAIAAMKTVVAQLPSAKLTLVGRHDDSRYERELETLARRLNLTKNIEFRFDVGEDEKKAILLGSTLMVVPSAVEGFGIVVLEANASGVPVIASSGVPASVVRDGENGLRYSYGDIAGLSTALLRASTDPALWSQLSKGSVANSKQYLWSSVGPRFLLASLGALPDQPLALDTSGAG